MSSCRKRCKREILKFAQYLFRFITGTLNAGKVHGFSAFFEVFHLGNIAICVCSLLDSCDASTFAVAAEILWCKLALYACS